MSADLKEMSYMVNAASSALSRLPSTRGVHGTERMTVLRSLRADLESARLRGVSYQKIADSLRESIGMQIDGVALSRCMKQLAKEEREAAAKISRQLAEKHAERRCNA